MSDEADGTKVEGKLEVNIGYVTEVTYEHHEMVAILENAGVELTPRPGDQSGEAYA